MIDVLVLEVFSVKELANDVVDSRGGLGVLSATPRTILGMAITLLQVVDPPPIGV